MTGEARNYNEQLSATVAFEPADGVALRLLLGNDPQTEAEASDDVPYSKEQSEELQEGKRSELR